MSTTVQCSGGSKTAWGERSNRASQGADKASLGKVDNSLEKAQQRKEEPGQQAEEVCGGWGWGKPDHKGPQCHGPANGTELTEVS